MTKSNKITKINKNTKKDENVKNNDKKTESPKEKKEDSFLDSCLNEYEDKVKKLNFCKKILSSSNIFSVDTTNDDKELLKQMQSFVKEKVEDFSKTIIDPNHSNKDKLREISDEDYVILRNLIDRVKTKTGVNPNNGSSRFRYERKPILDFKKQKDPMPVLPGIGTMHQSDPSSNNGESRPQKANMVNVVVSNHAILETSGVLKSDIPINESVEVLGENEGYYKCIHPKKDANGNVIKSIVFQIPKDDVEKL